MSTRTPRHSTGWSLFRHLTDRNAPRTPIPAPEKTPRYPVSEAIIISRSGLTPAQWDRLTDQERADIRWNLDLGATA